MNIFNQKERIIAEKVALLPGIKEGIYKLYENISPEYIKVFDKKQDAQSMFEEDIDSLQNSTKFDLLIVKEEIVVLCISFCTKDDVEKNRLFGDYFDEMPILKLSKTNFSTEELEFLLHYIDKKIQDSNDSKYILSTISMESVVRRIGFSEKDFQNIMIQEHLLYRWTNGILNKCYQFLPTEYGSECGLIKSYVVNVEGIQGYELFGTEITYQKLKEIFNWKKVNQRLRKKKISLNKRINNLKSGKPSNDAYLVALVKKSANIPIEVYFQQQPDKLSELKIGTKEYDNTLTFSTYLEAVKIIHDLMMQEKYNKRGVELMMLLAEPYLYEFQERSEKYEKKPKDKIDKTSINELFPVFKMPISLFYLGVSMITNRKYFDWFYKRKIEKYETLDLVNMVNFTNEMIELAKNKKEAEKLDQLLFQLIIEPFYELI